MRLEKVSTAVLRLIVRLLYSEDLGLRMVQPSVQPVVRFLGASSSREYQGYGHARYKNIHPTYSPKIRALVLFSHPLQGSQSQ